MNVLRCQCAVCASLLVRVEKRVRARAPVPQSIVAFPGPGESESLAAVAPLYVFRKNTVAKIISEFLTSCTAPGPVEQNAQLLAWLPTAVPVYALNVG